MIGRINVADFVGYIDQIQQVNVDDYRNLCHIADSPATPNDIRKRIYGRAGRLLNVHADLLENHTEDQAVLNDAEALTIRLTAISRRHELIINPLLTAIEDPAHPALTAIADAADVPQTIREALNTHKAQLGKVDLSAHLGDEQVLTDPVTRRLRAAAIARRTFLNSRISHFNAIQAAIAAETDLAHLPNLAADATPQVIRQALHAQRAHLGGVDFTAHDNDEVVITNTQANELKRLIIARRQLLESREQNFRMIRDAIDALNRPEEAIFDALTTVINADTADFAAIRRALNQPHVRALLGKVDLTGHEALELKLSNAQVAEIHRLALAKRTALVNGIPDQARRISLNSYFRISAITDSEAVQLQILADADENAVAVRTAIYESIDVAARGGHQLHGHLSDETVLTDADALALRKQAILKRSALRRAAIETLITAKVTGNKDHLDDLMQAVGADAIREALHENENLGNFHIENPAQLTDDDALAIRRAAINKYNQLIGRTAVDEMAIPAAGTDEHTRLMAHIQDNIRSYVSRIARAEEMRRVLRHTQDESAHTKIENMYQSLVNMRNQLSAYQSHLESGAGEQAYLPLVKQNIDKVSLLLKKIDEKHNKEIATIGHYSKDSQVVDAADADALVKHYLGGQSGVLNGALETNSPLKKTERFASKDHEGKVRVNHLEIEGKDKQTAHMVSVQKMVNDSYISELHFDPSKLNLSRRWFSNIPNDDVMKWAIAEIENFRIGNPHPERPIEIAGNMPEECVKALGLYCQYKNYKYQNMTKHTIEKMDQDQKSELIARFNERGDYLVGRQKQLMKSHALAAAIEDKTERQAVMAMT